MLREQISELTEKLHSKKEMLIRLKREAVLLEQQLADTKQDN